MEAFRQRPAVPRGRVVCVGLLGGIVAVGALGVRAAAAGPGTDRARGETADATSYAVDWIVRVDPAHPDEAAVSWRFAGIDEIDGFRLVFRDARASDVRGTGRLDWQGRTLHWTPGGPYAHFEYRVAIDRRRSATGFDSHAGPDWIATRARHLFPQIHVRFHAGAETARSRARLIFELPPGWASEAAYARSGEHTFTVVEPGKKLDRPRGWFLLGRIGVTHARIAGSEVTVATAPGSALDVPRLLRLWERTMPLLVPMLGPPPTRLLLVSAPDPMWRGGISGEDSLYVHGNLPLRSSDETSTYLHELVHVWQPFRAKPDGRWASEGLAEYWALLLQRRAGTLSAERFARGLGLFASQGRWGEDLSQSHSSRVLNNDAPLVMAALDAEIRRATDGRRSLDDAVRGLASEAGPLTTARLLGEASRAAGHDLTPFFRRHVLRGEQPVLPEAALASLPAPATMR